MMDMFFNGVNKQQILDFAQIFYVQIAFAIVIGTLFIRSVIARTIIKIVDIFLKKKERTVDSPIYISLKNFILAIGIYFASLILPFSEKITYIINELFKIVLILFVTKVLTVMIHKDSKVFKKIFSNSKNESVNSFLCKMLRGILWGISILIIFKNLGWDLTGLVAGLGVGSVIISLAAQDTVKSLLSGVTILTEKPFEIGDWIRVKDYQGTVLDITFKSTRIKASDNTIITIPNSLVTEECVINWNKLKARRFDCVLNLTMSTTAEQIRILNDKIKLVLSQIECIDQETVHVVFDGISSYSSDLRIFFYVNETDYIKYLEIKEKIYYSLLELVDNENIDLAYPTQTVYLDKANG